MDFPRYNGAVMYALVGARLEACSVMHWGQGDGIERWCSLYAMLEAGERLQEACAAFNSSFAGRPFRRIAEGCYHEALRGAAVAAAPPAPEREEYRRPASCPEPAAIFDLRFAAD